MWAWPVAFWEGQRQDAVVSIGEISALSASEVGVTVFLYGEARVIPGRMLHGFIFRQQETPMYCVLRGCVARR